MKRSFRASVWQEGKWFIAQCIEVDVASQGQTEEEALENLRDALELHFNPAQQWLADMEDLLDLRAAKDKECDAPTVSLDEIERHLDETN